MWELYSLSNVGLLLLFLVVGGFVCWGWSAFGGLISISMLGNGLLEYMFDFLIDDISIVSLAMLGFCGSVALLYCHHYFGGSVDGYLLYPLMVWFLGVMGILIFTSSLLPTLVMWEYLGLVSFFLILFYSNGASLRASLVTLFASRFGDVALFFVIMWISSWAYSVCSPIFVFLVCLVILTKSACYPFISWLLEAMRAPTPVSSLVHSSTLVAAGVWFLFRYGDLLGDSVFCVLFYLAIITILITGLCASFFCDLKKIVALSTCNNVAWCLIFYVCGDLQLALLQLLTHGVCKCYLFMSVGDLMSLSGGSQSSVGVFMSRYVGGYGVVLQTVLILSLSGLPFLGVFFSKHCLFSGVLYSYGLGFFCLVLFGFLLTYIYSVRFVLLLIGFGGGLSLGYSSSFIIICGVSVVGAVINLWGAFMCDEVLIGSGWASFLLLAIQFFGCLLGSVLYLWDGFGFEGRWESFLWGSDCLVGWFYGVYLSVSSVCVISFYRWETYVGSLLFSGVYSGKGLLSFLSLNFMVCSLCYIFFALFLLSGLGV